MMMLRAFSLVTILCCGAVFCAEAPPPASRRPVLVELFTSEGCSSCPPAEQQLAHAEKNQPYEGIEIIPLAWHVDYWNSPWVDPFSMKQATARQREYQERFGLQSVYTPQVVADGVSEFVGGEKKAFADAMAQAVKSPKGRIELTVKQSEPGEKIAIGIAAHELPRLSRGDEVAEVFALITEDGLRVAVKRGENGGSTLRHSAVVRYVRKVGQLAADTPDRFTAETAIALDGSWRRDQLRAVVFIQERGSGRILATVRTRAGFDVPVEK
jgi:hypothetical protein